MLIKAQASTTTPGPMQSLGISSISPTTPNAFEFEPIAGVFTAGQAVTATANGQFAFFEVVLSEDTQPPLTIATIEIPALANPGLEPFTFTVPTAFK